MTAGKDRHRGRSRGTPDGGSTPPRSNSAIGKIGRSKKRGPFCRGIGDLAGLKTRSQIVRIYQGWRSCFAAALILRRKRMKTKLVINKIIEINCHQRTCGDCIELCDIRCTLFDTHLEETFYSNTTKRCPECLAAEKEARG